MAYCLSSTSEDCQAWQRHLEGCLARAGAGHLCPRETLKESAAGVAAYLSSRARRVSDHTVHLLLARAMWSVGADEAAVRLMETGEVRASEGRDEMALTRVPAGSSDTIWWLAGSGALRPVRLLSAGSTDCWLLDFRRLGIETWLSVDLALLPAARRLVEMLAPVWDTCAGDGGLALSGWNGEEARSGGEVADYLRNVLDRIGAARGWKHRPHVVVLRNGVTFSG